MNEAVKEVLQTIKNVGLHKLERLLYVLEGLLCKPKLHRFVAFLADMVIFSALFVCPGMFGYIMSFGFYLMRDAFPFDSRQSFGKSLYALHLVVVEDNRQAPWRLAFVRNLLSLVPILGLLDVIYFVFNERRLIDEWLGTDVIFGEKEVPEGTNPPVED